MYQQGQYQLIDYILDGHTYPGGIIIIKSIWHSVDATRLANKILTLPTDFGEMDNEPVSLALYRLLAEEPNQLYVADSGRMMHELRQLDSRPWQNIDNIKRLNSSTSQISGIIYSTKSLASNLAPTPTTIISNITPKTCLSLIRCISVCNRDQSNLLTLFAASRPSPGIYARLI